MTMKVLVVDDELNNRILLTKLLEKVDSVSAIDSAKTALEALKKINFFNPDIILLDIEMPGGSGMDLLSTLPERNFKVVFI